MTDDMKLAIVTAMSSTVRVNKNGQVYLYESESYWDKEKKAPRSRMVYLGREDPATKEVVPPGKKWMPKSSRDYGNAFLLSRISMQIGLTEVLQETFPDQWQELLACVLFEASEGKPLYLCNSWLEGTHTDLIDRLPSQRVSELLRSVGENVHARLEFARLWNEKRCDDKFIVFDITSISSYSKLIESVEWGYNRDKEKLAQINFGMVFGQPSLLPLFYDVYQGSIRDVSTLQNILEFLTDFKVKNVTFVLDKGFYSADNIAAMKKKRLHFITPLPFSVDEAESLIEKHAEEILDVSNAFRTDKEILHCVSDKVTIEGYSLNAYIYFDKRRRLEGEERLLEKIMEAEEKVQAKGFRERQKAHKYLCENASAVKGLVQIRKVKGAFVLKRETARIAKAISRMGYVTILSSRKMRREEIIVLYRNKDCVEKCFDNMKNELSTNRLRVHSKETMDGRLFTAFLTLILSSQLHNSMREQNMTNKYTIDEVMYETRKLKITELKSGKKLLTEISKTQKDLFKKLADEIPSL